MDSLSKTQRSWNMSRIRSENTRPELMVRRLLRQLGYQVNAYSKRIPGNPDIVLRKYRTVVFVHGCFWHQHAGCKRSSLPKSNRQYWLPKLKGNIKRFNQVRRLTRKLGWRHFVVWECQTKNSKTLSDVLHRHLPDIIDS
jgi:DNA mismatch endonuclease (patch repair protein)